MRLASFLAITASLTACRPAASQLGGGKEAQCPREHQARMSRPRDPARPDEMSPAALEAAKESWVRSHVYIPREEAVERAERWLEAQGFTDAPPSAGVRVSHDIVDFGSDGEILERRHNTVASRAVGTMKIAGFWLIAFQRGTRSSVQDPAHGRGVLVSYDGARLGMKHQSVCLPLFDDY